MYPHTDTNPDFGNCVLLRPEAPDPDEAFLYDFARRSIEAQRQSPQIDEGLAVFFIPTTYLRLPATVWFTYAPDGSGIHAMLGDGPYGNTNETRCGVCFAPLSRYDDDHECYDDDIRHEWSNVVRQARRLDTNPHPHNLTVEAIISICVLDEELGYTLSVSDHKPDAASVYVHDHAVRPRCARSHATGPYTPKDEVVYSGPYRYATKWFPADEFGIYTVEICHEE